MVEWVETRLGKKAMDPHERALRFVEEALELAQAVGLTEPDIDRLRHLVFRKPLGHVGQEIGGVVTTLLTLSESWNTEMTIAALMEIDRIHELPMEKFRKRQKQNVKDGIGAPAKL